jgi:hypothetical protein
MHRILSIAAVAIAGVLLAAPSPASATIRRDGFHQIVNRQDFVCVGVVGGSTLFNAEVRVEPCFNQPHQRWILNSDNKLVAASSGLCLSVEWGSDPWASNVVQHGCAHAPAWSTEELGGGWTRLFTFAPRGDRLCLDKSWSDLTVWGCHDRWWQQWQSLG